MKYRIYLLVACLLFGAGSVSFAEREVLTVAIFDFESKDAGAGDLGQKVATLLSANLSAEPQVITVERAELAKILGEQELGLSGTVSPETAAKVGKLTGAKVIVTGRVFRADKELLFVAKVIGTETSRVYGELVKGNAANAAITDMSAELARKIAGTLAAKGDQLVAKVETREQLIDKIKKQLKGDKLPSVSIKIAERHFGQVAIDPAAETELSKILQECGFKIIDDQASGKPDVEMAGEAFSAFGMRKGNLFSCTSRIELKAHKRDGALIFVDRQTSVAVDIAEQSAAKDALASAAAAMAERVAVKLGESFR
jgi:molybdopterin-binding protein